MEKPAANDHKLRNKIMKLLLPKAISFQNQPFSPRRDTRPDVRPRIHHNKAFSGPMIPAEARGKSHKNFETQEPTSPTVSCTGRVKHKKSKITKKKHVSLPRELIRSFSQLQPDNRERAGTDGPGKEKKKNKGGIKTLLWGGKKSGEPAVRAEPGGESAPGLSHMRRFASSRETFANFDWTTAQIAPEEGFSDDGYSDDEGGAIPFSAPISMGGGGLDLEGKKEINIWKRRTMAQPSSLELNKGGEIDNN